MSLKAALIEKNIKKKNIRDTLPWLKHVFKTCDISIVRELNIHIRIREGDENNYIYKFKELVLNKFKI